MKTFTLNGKTIVAKPFDFNMVCDLEDYGVSLEEFETKPMKVMRTYVALCLGITVASAGLEMQSHVIGGGNFESLTDVIAKEIEESDFFQALNKTTEEDAPKTTTKKTTTKATK